MKQHLKLLLQIIGMLTILLLLATCGTQGIPQEQQGTITTESVQVVPGSHIEFEGRSTLPDSTCLYTQLSTDGTSVAWWPAQTCVEVEGGNWQFRVQLGENGVPQELSGEKQYTLNVWESGNPSIQAESFWFDLSGPPEPEN